MISGKNTRTTWEVQQKDRKKWKNRILGAEEYNNWRSQYRTAEFSKQKRESLSKKRDQVKLSNQGVRRKKEWKRMKKTWGIMGHDKK